jgi:sugar phosphate isomerase/epimerase
LHPVTIPIDRRTFVVATLATLATSSHAADRPFFKRHGLPIGIQFYTLGPDAATEFDATLGKLATIGYRAVELQGLLGRSGAMLRASLDAAGLSCTSIHVSQSQLDGDLGTLADELAAIGIRTAITPRPYFPARIGTGPANGESSIDWFRRALARMTTDDWKRNADVLNEKGAALAKWGIKIGYHNHNGELAPLAGSTGLELLIRHTDRHFVTFELDIGWLVAAGRDPLAFLARYKGRFALMHVKDVASGTQPNYALAMNPTEVGSGGVAWRRVLPAAYAAGVRGFYVEQEPPFQRPRLEAAQISYDYLAGLAA